MSQSGSERRQWPRIPAKALGHITASVVAGPAVRLVNLSRGGALMEVASRFPMRSRVRLKLTQNTGEVTVAEGLVAWARVAAIVDKQVNYLVAVIFDSSIPDLGGLDAWPEPEERLPEIIAPPLAVDAAAPRDNLTQFPRSLARAPETPAESESWNDADEQVVALDGGDANPVDVPPSQPSEELAVLSAANETLTAQLAAAEAERVALRDHLDTQRRVREEERAKLVQEIADAAVTVGALQTTLAVREQEYAQALAEQRAQVHAGSGLSTLAAREQEHAGLVAQLAEQQARYVALQSTLETREQEHSRAVAELSEQQARCEALQSSLTTREQDHHRVFAELTDRETLIEILQASLAAREREQAHAAAALTDEYARREALEAAVAAREDERAQALEALNEQQGRYEALQSEFVTRKQEHVRAVNELAAQQDRYDALRIALSALEQEHAHAVAELVTQQERYDGLQASFAAREQEHVRAVAELAALRNQLETLHASITGREQEHERALAQHASDFEALTAELVQASHDQQAEYQLLMDERAAARVEERRRLDAHALELAQLQEQATQEREQLELQNVEIQARLDAAQALCAAQEARARGLRRELEKLASMVTSLIGSNQDQAVA